MPASEGVADEAHGLARWFEPSIAHLWDTSRVTDDELSIIRDLNVVLSEDADTITAVSPCPTAAHRPTKVAPRFVARFRCPHGESQDVFCAPCASDRRAGRYACLGRELVSGKCPGSVVVEMWTLTPTTKRKG
jgi:hypothetical protein